MTRRMRLAAIGIVSALTVSSAGWAADADSCKAVRFSDVGWTDITSTTAATSVVLEGLGYEPSATVLSVPVTYTALKNGDIDIFLGNWMPTMEADIAPYREDGSVETVGMNLDRRQIHARPSTSWRATAASGASATSPSTGRSWKARSTASSPETTATV